MERPVIGLRGFTNLGWQPHKTGPLGSVLTSVAPTGSLLCLLHAFWGDRGGGGGDAISGYRRQEAPCHRKDGQTDGCSECGPPVGSKCPLWAAGQ